MLKLHWITSTSLSLVRAVQSCADSNPLALTTGAGKSFPLKDPGARERFAAEARQVSERLITAAISESLFWDHLQDELLASGNDSPLTPRICEVALLRAGHSQLQSDQTAAAIDRSLDHCRRLMTADSPRWADQLRLRYAPLKQAYEAYGPGMLRLIGNRIWNGSPPKNWWPGRVTVHAVAPLQSGAAGRSNFQSSVWIEAVLTDISPAVPEWLRLVYQLTLLAIDTQTRTSASLSADGNPPTELPWSLGIIPLILDQTGQAGVLPPGRLPIAEAFDLWWAPEESTSHEWIKKIMRDSPHRATSDFFVETLERWWREAGSNAQAFPIALKQLSAVLASSDVQKRTN